MEIEQHLFQASPPTAAHPRPQNENLTSHDSLVDSLIELSTQRPLDIAFTFLTDGELDEQNLTFRQLDLASRAVAANLRETLPFGARVGLSFESGLDYIVALVGCFYAGIVAVPIYPPDPLRWSRTVTRLQSILDDAQTDVVLTTQDQSALIKQIRTNATVVATDTISIEDGAEFRPSGINRETLALLQYTSGSTGTPKGVMLTHSNLMFNFEHIREFDEPNAVAVSWLPMYHDMGLIGLVLQVLQSGRRTVLMSPLSFIKRPLRWLQAISKYRAYATSGPSFAYELCVRKIDLADCQDIDLSGWTLAVNGAEPIRAETLTRFAEKFEPLGFRSEAFYPSYGLAEATLIVSGGRKSDPPVVTTFDAASLDRGRAVSVPTYDMDARTLVGCGQTVARQRVTIVDPATSQKCPEKTVGEIWVCGPGVAMGYWNNAEATRQTFAARTTDDDGPFLRTGDLGFLKNDELFVTGRLKDLIIIRGRNHYPQEIEQTVIQCLPENRAGQGAAFSADVNGQERLVIVQSVVRHKSLDKSQIFADIRQSLLREHDVAPHAIALVSGGQIPHTSSGKVQRRACRSLYLAQKLTVVASWHEESAASNTSPTKGKEQFKSNPRTDSTNLPTTVEGIVRTISPLLAQLKNGKAHQNVNPQTMLFSDLGLESIDVAVLTELIERHFERQFPFIEFMTELGQREQRDVSMQELATFIQKCMDPMKTVLD